MNRLWFLITHRNVSWQISQGRCAALEWRAELVRRLSLARPMHFAQVDPWEASEGVAICCQRCRPPHRMVSILKCCNRGRKKFESHFHRHLLRNRFASRKRQDESNQIDWVFMSNYSENAWHCLFRSFGVLWFLDVSGKVSLTCTISIEVEGAVSSLSRWSFGLSCSSVWSIWRLGTGAVTWWDCRLIGC